MAASVDLPDTKTRVLGAALASFGTTGYDGTSLDDLAGALGLRKQTILYHFGSKRELLDAVVDRAADELVGTLEAAVLTSATGFARIESVVRSVFRLALRRPELLGLLREVSRPGSPTAVRLSERLEPLVERAVAFLEIEMAEGRLRPTDARLLLLSAYSTVVGTATEVEVLRAVGVEPTLRSMAMRRRELLRFLESALT
ncbi:MAG: TetR/AcrR family transcriptional regulator [Acidimicrobiales bacterium]